MSILELILSVVCISLAWGGVLIVWAAYLVLSKATRKKRVTSSITREVFAWVKSAIARTTKTVVCFVLRASLCVTLWISSLFLRASLHISLYIASLTLRVLTVVAVGTCKEAKNLITFQPAIAK